MQLSLRLDSLGLAGALAGAALGAALFAQDVPTRLPRDPKEVRSPMVLETVFLPADPAQRPKEWITGPAWEGLAEYHCENASLSALKMRVRSAAGGRLLVEIKASISVRRGHDKEVTVRFDVHNGDEEVARVTLGPVQVDETDTDTRAVSVEVPESALKTDPMTGLRITMTVRNI